MWPHMIAAPCINFQKPWSGRTRIIPNRDDDCASPCCSCRRKPACCCPLVLHYRPAHQYKPFVGCERSCALLAPSCCSAATTHRTPGPTSQLAGRAQSCGAHWSFVTLGASRPVCGKLPSADAAPLSRRSLRHRVPPQEFPDRSSPRHNGAVFFWSVAPRAATRSPAERSRCRRRPRSGSRGSRDPRPIARPRAWRAVEYARSSRTIPGGPVGPQSLEVSPQASPDSQYVAHRFRRTPPKNFWSEGQTTQP
mmetsp:Transcript_47997/g.127127  ORF Transcript_47997/g.127127 Transcript_47997/m.127127 type:complete len:251 (-) Transcript_47997:29-781(-)